MTSPTALALDRFGRAIAARDWPRLRSLLADDFRAQLLHTGETFGADGFVTFNRDYPGPWTYHLDEVVDGGDRAVLRSRTVIGHETWHAASFASVDAEGLLVDLLEVWSEATAPHPERNTP